MGRLNGKVCFVEGVLLGEEVEVAVIQEKKNYSMARLVSISQKSDARVEPPCEYYSKCGGCQYQHMDYKEELSMKEAQVREAFRHELSTQDALIESIQSCDTEGYRYRHTVTLRPLHHSRTTPTRLGYVGRDNASSIVVDDCLLADKGLKEVFTAKMKLPRNIKRVSFGLSKDGQIMSSLPPSNPRRTRPSAGKEKYYRVVLGGKEICAVSDGFFQNNHRATERIAQELSKTVKLFKPEGFFDLYAGVGTFSLLAAAQVPQIISVEESKSSSDCLYMNREQHRLLSSWKHYTGKVEKYFLSESKKVSPEKFMVFLDPPRAGVHPAVADFLSTYDAFRALAYLSCDLGNLMRDIKKIMAGKHYEIDRVIPFDMFPRTQHIETLVLLKPVKS